MANRLEVAFMNKEPPIRPTLRTALSNRTIQIMLSVLALSTLSAGAWAVSASSAPPLAGPQRAQVEEVVRTYILDHPEILTQAMERLRDRKTTEAISSVRSNLEKPYHKAWEGAASADVTVVEFFDYACGYCRAALPDIDKLLASDKSVRIVYRELPILSDLSTQAARVSLLVAEKGNYPVFHRALYAAGRLGKPAILAAAQASGIPAAAAEAAMDDKSRDGEIDSNIALAQKINASGTPTFVVGDQVLVGAVGHDALKAAVDKARARQ